MEILVTFRSLCVVAVLMSAAVTGQQRYECLGVVYAYPNPTCVYGPRPATQYPCNGAVYSYPNPSCTYQFYCLGNYYNYEYPGCYYTSNSVISRPLPPPAPPQPAAPTAPPATTARPTTTTTPELISPFDGVPPNDDVKLLGTGQVQLGRIFAADP